MKPNSVRISTCKRMASALSVIGVMLGGFAAVDVTLASPAAASCYGVQSASVQRGSRAETHTDTCAMWGRSIARHGGVYRDSGWWPNHSYASAFDYPGAPAEASYQLATR